MTHHAKQDTHDAAHENRAELRIALALSGGGVRASAFHMGVLRFLAFKGLINNVKFLSTVSGGSLVVGLLMQKNQRGWPQDLTSFTKASHKVEGVLTGKSLQLSAILRMLNPINWRHIFSRANVVADSLESLWGIEGTLGTLPTLPVWEINGTTMETGRRWRFISGPGALMGDGVTGNWRARNFRLAEAMAASAAFPGGVTPLRVFADPKDATLRYPDSMNEVLRASGRNSWHVADGGVYDNLGLEPLFDASTRKLLHTCGCNFIMVCDAGSPLKYQNWGLWAQGFGFGTRTINVMHAQGRNMRTRSFVGAIVANTINGLFLNIARSREETLREFRRQGNNSGTLIALQRGCTRAEVNSAALFPTTLKQLTKSEYKLLEQHGFETAETQWVLYGQRQILPNCSEPSEPCTDVPSGKDEGSATSTLVAGACST